MLVVEPSEEVFQSILSAAPTLPAYDGGDTGLLNAFFSDWFSSEAERRLPFAYNAQRTLFWFTQAKCPGYWDSCRPLKVIHFSSSPKPWECPPGKSAVGGDLEWIWWQVYLGNIRSLFQCFNTRVQA